LFLTKSNILQMDKELEEAENNLEKAVKSYSSENVKLKNTKL